MCSVHLQPWRWKQYVSPKRYKLTIPHGVTVNFSPKMEAECSSKTLVFVWSLESSGM
jgi:hypothetical protein